MPEYKKLDLREINPCGTLEIPSTRYPYSTRCATLGKTSGEFICISRQGYLVATYLFQGSDTKTEESDLRGFLEESMGKNFIDPQTEWGPKQITKTDVGVIARKAVERGQAMVDKLKDLRISN
jgi:hypothetical protein